jgi:hypothetical protein
MTASRSGRRRCGKVVVGRGLQERAVVDKADFLAANK